MTEDSSPRAFGHAEMIQYFAEVDAELGRRYPSVSSTLVVVGGAAMTERVDGRSTNDVDVISEGMTNEIREAARTIAQRHNLRPDWINDAAKMKTVAVQPNLEDLYVGARLRVYSGGPRYVLAMKLVSGRELDLPDCVHLIRELEVDNPEVLLDLIEEALPNPSTRTAKMEYFALKAFNDAQTNRGAGTLRRKLREFLTRKSRP